MYDLNAKYSLFNAQEYYNFYITAGLYNAINFNRKYENRNEISSYSGNENKFDFGYCMGLGYEFKSKQFIFRNFKFNLEYKFYDRFVENKNQSNIYPLWNPIHFGGVSVMYSL